MIACLISLIIKVNFDFKINRIDIISSDHQIPSLFTQSMRSGKYLQYFDKILTHDNVRFLKYGNWSTWSRALPNDRREHSLDYILIARGSTLLATQLYSGGALPESDYYRLREYKVHQSLSIWLRCPDTWSCKQCLMILWMRLCTVL